MKQTLVFGVILITTLVQAHSASAEERYPWKAGAASIVITPEKPVVLAGYLSKFHLSFGIVQDLRADALVLEDAKGTKIVFLTCDLCDITPDIRSWLEAKLAQKHKIAPESLLINVSAAHGAPLTQTEQLKYYDKISKTLRRDGFDYIEQLKQKLVKVVEQAIQKMEPVKIDYSVGKAGFAMSRRKPIIRNNKTIFEPGLWPDGPFDHDVPVLRIADPSGKKLQAVLFGYACRGKTPEGRMTYGGFAGFARDFLREKYPDAVFLFMTGCGGDQNPFAKENSYDDFREIGRELAQAVDQCIQGTVRPVNGPLVLALEPVTLMCEEAPSREDLEEWKKKGGSSGRARATALLDQLKRTGKISTEYSVPIQVIRFGHDLLMIALPGEPVVDYSLQFKKAFASKTPTWVAGFCNDSVAQLPTLKILREGGDEGGRHIRGTSLVLSGSFDETVEKRIVQKVHELVKKTATIITKITGN